MQNKSQKVIQFWFVMFWLPLTAYMAFQKWPASYGPEFGEFMIRTALFGLTPFALVSLYFVGRKSISLSLSRRAAEAKAERIADAAIRKTQSWNKSAVNSIQKVLLLILTLSSPLITLAVLLTAGVISFGGKAQPFIIVALFLMAFSIPLILPGPQSDNDQPSSQNK